MSADALASALLRERWLRERLEDLYAGALGVHSGGNGLPPITDAAAIRSVLDEDLSDTARLEMDLCDPLPLLAPEAVGGVVRSALTAAHTGHRYDARCPACTGDAQCLGRAVAFGYADLAETLPADQVAALPPGPSLARLVSLVAEVVVTHEWSEGEEPSVRRASAHGRHRYDGRCAICVFDLDRLTAAVTDAYVSLTGTARA